MKEKKIMFEKLTVPALQEVKGGKTGGTHACSGPSNSCRPGITCYPPDEG